MKITVRKGNSIKSSRVVETIDGNCKTAATAFKKINAWKEKNKSNGKYKIGHYDRVAYLEDKHRAIVYFGDGSCFIQIACASRDEWTKFVSSKVRSVDLEV